MEKLKGNPVSEGIAIGYVYKYMSFIPEVNERFFPPEGLSKQKEAYQKGKRLAQEELKSLSAHFEKEDPEKSKIFKAHVDILDDEVIDEEILESISVSNMNHDYAVFSVYNNYISILEKSKDHLIRERAVDLKDVRNRLVRCIYGQLEKNLAKLPRPSIVLAEDLFPSDTATLDRKNVIGIALEKGGPTSHSAIIAKSYGIPAVLGIGKLMETAGDGELAVLDATSGTLIIDPDMVTQEEYREKLEQFQIDKEYTRQFVSAKAVTKDGMKIGIGMNIGSATLPEYSSYCDYIGLFRTEFLYMEKNHMPTEDEQLAAYQSILSDMGRRPVTLRTLDIGGDKKLNYLPLLHEDNPFLGKRAIRLCFDYPDMFITQLRAALRASVQGELHIMFPMVGSLEDWRKAKSTVAAAKAGLDAEGKVYSDHIKLGVMIEIPSAVIFADKLAQEVDFASVGTNDLCQYLFAADRMNPTVTEYYQEFSPILFRALKRVASVFTEAGKPISICGQLCGNPMATAALIGIGFKKLSMDTSSFGKVKRILTAINESDAVILAQQILELDTEQQVYETIKEFYKRLGI